MGPVKFHLAIPSNDISDSMEFYSRLGCKIGRYNKEFCIFDFFGSQLVVHKTDKLDYPDGIYPRHFGILMDEKDWHYIYEYCRVAKIDRFKDPFIRHAHTPHEHTTFFLQDPSGNLLEFKTYKDQRSI